MGYDGFGCKVSMNDPDMGPWSYAYDAAGNLTEQLDANQKRLCFTYDVLDRLTYKRHDSNNNGCESGDAQLAYYAYFSSGTGKVGRPSEIRWSASSTQNRETFNYDTLGRLTTHTRIVDGRSYTVTTSNFDALHRPATVTYPNGEVVALTFDREGKNNLEAGNNLLVTDTFGLWYTLCMDASEARAYIQRWEAVSELEKQERKSHSVADNWRQLNAIRQRAARLGICRQNDDGEMALILLWARLKAQYGNK
jgi:YD repeat-containing protein